MEEVKQARDSVKKKLNDKNPNPSIGYIIQDEKKGIKFNFIHPTMYQKPQLINREAITQADIAYESKSALKLDTSRLVKYLRKSQLATYGPTYESLNGCMSLNNIKDLYYYCQKPTEPFKYSQQVDNLLEDVDESIARIIKNTLGIDWIPKKSKMDDLHQDCIDKTEETKKLPEVNENKASLDQISSQILELDKMTNQQYSVMPKEYVPYLSEEQVELNRDINQKLTGIIET
ncbi:MAG: hypothetical protein MHPSP_001985, partial [Paramarteilia canceri]